MTRARVNYEISFRYGGVIFQTWTTFFAYLRERTLSLTHEMTPAPTLGFRLNAQILAKQRYCIPPTPQGVAQKSIAQESKL